MKCMAHTPSPKHNEPEINHAVGQLYGIRFIDTPAFSNLTTDVNTSV